MKRILAFVALIAALFLSAGPARAERIIDLPEDGGKYYTSVFLNDGSDTIPNWFQSDSRLAGLKTQTQFNVVRTTDPQFAERYGKAVTDFPCVVITKADGSLIFKASGKNVPNRPGDLVAMIRAAATVKAQPTNAGPVVETARYRENCEVARCDGRCNGQCGHDSCRCRPKPAPVTPVVEPPKSEIVPDLLGPGNAPESSHDFPFWLGALLAVGGVGAAIVPKIMGKYKSLEIKV